MAEYAATTTFLVCSSSPTMKICLGASPPGDDTSPHEAKSPVKYFFRVDLTNVKVALPNAANGTEPPANGTVCVTESLTLSHQDMNNLYIWMKEYFAHE